MFNNEANRDLNQQNFNLTSIPYSLEFAEADSLLDFFKEATQKIHLLNDDYLNLTYSIKKILLHHKAIFNFEFCSFFMAHGPLKDQIFCESATDITIDELKKNMAVSLSESKIELTNLAKRLLSDSMHSDSVITRLECPQFTSGKDNFFLYPYISKHVNAVFSAKSLQKTSVTVRKLYELICLTSMQAMDQIVENSALKTQISHDYLTRLHNKEAFDNALDREIGRADRFKTSFVLLLFDLDNFKLINDEAGYLTGDLVIKTVGDVFRENTRNIDFTARIGGDEFAMILPEFDLKETANFVDRLNNNFKNKVAGINSKISSALSCGHANYPADGDDCVNLFHTANTCLKKSKSSR